MMIHISICDDEQIIMEIERAVRQFFKMNCVECKVTTYQSSENLQYDLEEGISYDLFLLDIEMPGIDGMELAKEIHDKLPSAKIIFITSHLEYAITAYEFSVFRYIPKFMLEEKLSLALEDYYKLYRLERNEYYTVAVKSHVEHIPYREILYILKDGKYAVLYLYSGRTISVRKTLKQIYDEMNQEYFCFADRGCIINLANVLGMDEDKILFPKEQNVVINKANRTDFKKTMIHFWGKQI